MKIIIDHKLTREQALNCVKSNLEILKEKHKNELSNLVHTWNGYISTFSVSAKGFKIEGELTVLDNQIEIKSKLPLAFKIFGGMIEKTIRENANKFLDNCSKNL